MKKFFPVVFAAALFALTGTAGAESQTVTLAVENMSCAVCPITVKKALNDVAGVSRTDVSFESKEATVTFDDAKTNIETLIKATTNAGYPSRLK